MKKLTTRERTEFLQFLLWAKRMNLDEKDFRDHWRRQVHQQGETRFLWTTPC